MAACSTTVIAGLTGGVGAGKSLAAALCREWDIPVADADDWAHDVLVHDADVRMAVAREYERRYDGCVQGVDGALERAELAARAFTDRSFLRFLEDLIHPRVRDRARQWAAARRHEHVALAVLIVPLLFESGMDGDVDCTIAIAAAPEMRAARLAATRGWSDEAIARRMSAQMNEHERRRRADYTVGNEGTPAEFSAALKRVLQEIQRARGAPCTNH